jgi:biopolymer transport protein TolQ
MDQIIHENEVNLSILSVSAAVAPLIGLFATVWGLIHSFVSISALKNADITTVAPGIAEALIVTLAGLMVAIPALVSFHSIATRIRDLEHRLQNLLSKVEFVIRNSN